MRDSYCIKWYGKEVGYLYVVWYKILHIPYQMHKLDKSQTKNETGEAKGATPSVSAQRIIWRKKMYAYHYYFVIITIILSIILVIMIRAKLWETAFKP